MNFRFRSKLLPSEYLRRAQEELDAAIAARVAMIPEYNAAKKEGGDAFERAKAARFKASHRIYRAKTRIKNAMRRARPDIPDPIARMIESTKDAREKRCIEWPNNRNAGGYGLAYWRGRRQLAHRLAFAVAQNVDVESLIGVVIRHKCDNPACINQWHLESGTQADNVQDMIDRNRFVNRSLKGSAVRGAKLSESDIPVIRARLAAGESSTRIIQEYGVSKSTVNRIRRGESWSHVE